MNPDEHLALARQLRADSSDLWDGGRVHLAAEALWGVVNHLASAVLKHERQNDTDTNLSERRNLAHRLFAGNPSTRYIYESWSWAGSLHGHFYNGNLTPEQLRQRRVQALLLADNLERVLVTMRPGEAR